MSDSKGNEKATAKPGYILIGYPSMALGDREIRRGEEIDVATFKRIHKGSHHAFARVGAVLPREVYDRLPRELQKRFTVKD